MEPNRRSSFGPQNDAAPPDRVWIVGGGPSLRGFDFRCLRDEYVLVVNDAFRSLPLARGVVSIDAHWQAHRLRELSTFSGTRYICHREGAQPSALPGSILIPFVSEPDLSHSWRRIHAAGSSGYAALNVAVLLGARWIGLLGFDYTNPGRHWHREYNWPSGQPADTWRQWGQAFSTCQSTLDSLGVQVINFNPESAITAFPTKEITCLSSFLRRR